MTNQDQLPHIKQALSQTYAPLIKEAYKAAESACVNNGLTNSVDEVFNSVIIEAIKGKQDEN